MNLLGPKVEEHVPGLCSLCDAVRPVPSPPAAQWKLVLDDDELVAELEALDIRDAS